MTFWLIWHQRYRSAGRGMQQAVTVKALTSSRGGFDLDSLLTVGALYKILDIILNKFTQYLISKQIYSWYKHFKM